MAAPKHMKRKGVLSLAAHASPRASPWPRGGRPLLKYAFVCRRRCKRAFAPAALPAITPRCASSSRDRDHLCDARYLPAIGDKGLHIHNRNRYNAGSRPALCNSPVCSPGARQCEARPAGLRRALSMRMRNAMRQSPAIIIHLEAEK